MKVTLVLLLAFFMVCRGFDKIEAELADLIAEIDSILQESDKPSPPAKKAASPGGYCRS